MRDANDPNNSILTVGASDTRRSRNTKTWKEDLKEWMNHVEGRRTKECLTF